MAKPIHNLQLSQISIDAIKRINTQLGYMQLALYFASVGHVMNVFLNISGGTASRAINISTQDWDDYNSSGSYAGLSASIINTVREIIRKEACLTMNMVSNEQERSFWQQTAGERCK